MGCGHGMNDSGSERSDDSGPTEWDGSDDSESIAGDGSETDADDPEYNVPLVVASLIAGVFFGGVGGGVAFPTLPTLGAVLGISPFVVGVILSTNRFTRLVMNTPAGQIIDKIGARKPMVIGFFLQGLAPFGYVLGLYADLVPHLGPAEIFILARALWGIGSAFVFVGAFRTVTEVTTPENRGKWIGYFRGGQSLGFPTGLVAGGLLTDAYGYEVAFSVAGSTGLFAAVVAFFVLPNVDASVGTPTRLVELPALVRADQRILAVGSVNFTVRFLYSGVLLSTVVLYAETYGIGLGNFSATGASGVIMAISVVSASVATVFSGTLSDMVDHRALVPLPALGLFALGFALLAAVPTLETTIVGVALIGVGVGGTNPPLLAYLGDISPGEDVGKMGGVYNVFGDLGSTLGPLVALPLASWVGYRVEYALCAMLVALTAVFVARTLLGSDDSPIEDPVVAAADD